MSDLLNLELNDEERFLGAMLTHRDYLDCAMLKRLYQNLGDERLFALCEQNLVTSIAADTLRQCLGEGALPAHWMTSYRAMERRIGAYMEALDRVGALLAEGGVALIALKNSGISRGLYPHFGACPMGDIDVLVCKSDFRKAHCILTDNGFVMKFRSPLEEENLEKAEQGGGAEYLVKLPEGGELWFELQWRPVAGRWIRPDQEPDAADLFERSVPIAGSATRMLSVEDNLLQVALHTAKHSYVRAPGFRLHTDVDRIVRVAGGGIDWPLFVGQVQGLQVRTAVYFSLALARDLLATPVPDEVLEQLRPVRWKVRLMSAWLQRVGLFDPEGQKWGRLGYLFFVALLYDDLPGLLKSVVPDRAWIQERYSNRNPFALPYLYIRRLLDVLLKRTLSKG
jgi:hypothetical protein